jgi:hypothetical protein
LLRRWLDLDGDGQTGMGMGTTGRLDEEAEGRRRHTGDGDYDSARDGRVGACGSQGECGGQVIEFG